MKEQIEENHNTLSESQQTTPLPSREGQGGGSAAIYERAVELLRTVFDPEIAVNVYDLGLIYRIELNDDLTQLEVDMTMTAPTCPMADFMMEDVRQKLETIEGLTTVNVNLVFEPEWTQDMMSEEAKLELGLL
jgi:FeS assembly SUF system protein